MKKLVNVVTLVVMVSVNTMTPFTYAFAQYDEPVYSQEVVEVSDDTADSSAGDSSSETWYEENIQGESPVDFSLNTESQTSAEEQWDTQDSQQSWVNFADAQNDDKQTEWSETQDEEPVEFDFSGKSAAAVTKMLGWDWDAESDYYAEVLWIENYRGLPEQNEIIRDYMVNNKSLPQRNVTKENTEDSSNNSEFQDEESDDEDPLPEEWDTQDSSLDAQNDSEQPEWEDEMWFFDELWEGIQNLFDKIRYFFTDEENESYIIYSEDDNNIWTITLKSGEKTRSCLPLPNNLSRCWTLTFLDLSSRTFWWSRNRSFSFAYRRRECPWPAGIWWWRGGRWTRSPHRGLPCRGRRGVVPVQYTGKSHLAISSMSRISPSRMIPATFFCRYK